MSYPYYIVDAFAEEVLKAIPPLFMFWKNGCQKR